MLFLCQGVKAGTTYVTILVTSLANYCLCNCSGSTLGMFWKQEFITCECCEGCACEHNREVYGGVDSQALVLVYQSSTVGLWVSHLTFLMAVKYLNRMLKKNKGFVMYLEPTISMKDIYIKIMTSLLN